MLRESDNPELRRRLLQGGIARSRVERLLRELDDHRHALREDALRGGDDPDQADAFAAAGLGDREVVLIAMLAQPELRSFAHRRSWLVHGLLPAFSLILAIALALFASWAALYGIGSSALWLRSLIDGLLLFVSHGALWLIVPGMLWHAHRNGVAPGWPALGALTAIGLGSALSVSMAWASAEAQDSFLHVTWLYGLRESLLAAAMVSLLVLPYAIAAWRRSCRARARLS